MADIKKHLSEGILLLADFKYKNAEGKFREGLKSDSKNALLWRYLGDCLVLQGRFREARDAHNTSIRYEPSFKVEMKITSRTSGPFGTVENEQVIDLTEHTARQVAPGDNPLGSIDMYPSFLRDSMKKSVEDAKAALKDDPTNVHNLKSLASSLFMFGDYKEALKTNAKLLSYEPDNWEAHSSFLMCFGLGKFVKWR